MEEGSIQMEGEPRIQGFQIDEHFSDLVKLIKKEVKISIPIKKGLTHLNFPTDRGKRYMELHEEV